MSAPKLMHTKNYDLFDLHENNRPIHKDPGLRESMRKYGFMPSSPIHVTHNGNGKFKIVRGHHRLRYAKELGLPVFFIVDDTEVDIFDLEGPHQLWNVSDFAAARANAGNTSCALLLKFQKAHGLAMGAACDLMAGKNADHKANASKLVKTGDFKVGDMVFANKITRITDRCLEKGIAFSTQTAFVKALCLCMRVPEFDPEMFLHKVETLPANLRKRGTTDEYLEEIQAFYNYYSKKPFALALEAKRIAKERHDTFGGKNKKKSSAQ